MLDPLGLDMSFVEGSGTPTGPIVHGYSNDEGGYTDMFAINTGYGMPDGGLISTAEDLASYIRAVATRAAPLSEASELAITDMVDTGDGDRYGLGISHWDDQHGFEAWGHGGNIKGYQSEMFYFPTREVTVVLLVNGSEGKFDALFEDVLDRAIELALE